MTRYNFKDLSGKRFGKLLVIKRIDDKIYKSGRKFVQWLCLCDCGIYKKILGDSLRGEHTKSCGCLSLEIPHDNNKTHGKTSTRLFSIWGSMKQRCYNKNHEAYQNYGNRDITICDNWLGKIGFQNFYDWAMINGYKNNLSIDRINNDKGYFPENCRWATASEQQQNRRHIITITYNNRTKTIREWCNIFNLNYQLISWRLKHNYSIENLFEPPRKIKSNKQSGIKGIIWQKKNKKWIVKSTKNRKKDCYISQFNLLDDAIKFKQQYEKINKIT